MTNSVQNIDNSQSRPAWASAATITMTTPEAARYLGLAVSTLNKWRCLGGGPKFLKLGRAVRYRQADLEAYLSSRQLRSTAEY